jgi:hypothetical protein
MQDLVLAFLKDLVIGSYAIGWPRYRMYDCVRFYIRSKVGNDSLCSAWTMHERLEKSHSSLQWACSQAMRKLSFCSAGTPTGTLWMYVIQDSKCSDLDAASRVANDARALIYEQSCPAARCECTRSRIGSYSPRKMIPMSCVTRRGIRTYELDLPPTIERSIYTRTLWCRECSFQVGRRHVYCCLLRLSGVTGTWT